MLNKIEMNIEDNEVVKLDNLSSNIINIGKNALLTININDSNFDNYIFNLSEKSCLIINKLYKNKDISEEVNINLNGFNSRVFYNFSVLSDKDEKFIININHNNKNTISKVINHGVVLNDTSLEFIVNAYVEKGNTKSVLNQSNKIITISKNNSIIKPNLFIDEFDVEAVHSATIGKFNKEDIFYLMTKGIKEEDAINLLIEGFLNGHIKEVNYVQR